MNRQTFLEILRKGLNGLPSDEISDIIGDYGAYFDDLEMSGRQEAEVAAALGNPSKIARELKANWELRRFEAQRTIPNMLTAGLALLGLAALDIFVLLPMLFVVCVIAICANIALIGLGIFGLKIALSSALGAQTESSAVAMGDILIGAGLISGAVALGAIMLLALGAAIQGVGRYARLHFQLLQASDRRSS